MAGLSGIVKKISDLVTGTPADDDCFVFGKSDLKKITLAKLKDALGITSINSSLTALTGGLPSSSGGRVEFTAHEYPAGECLIDEQVSTHKCTIAYMRLYFANDRSILIGAMFGSEDPDWWSKYVATSKLLIQKNIGSDYFGWTSI